MLKLLVLSKILPILLELLDLVVLSGLLVVEAEAYLHLLQELVEQVELVVVEMLM